jgi:P-type conjugative transfer protein TrbJ
MMYRLRLVALTFAAIMCTTNPTSAQTFSAVSSSIKTLPPLFALPCHDPLGFCNSANQYISAYNSYVSSINKINEIGKSISQYTRYPQQISSTFRNDMNTVANILQQSHGLNFITGGIERQVSLQWPNYSPGTPLSNLNQTLEDNTATSIVAALKGAGAIDTSNTDASTTKVISDIRTAGANAQNPTQAAQLMVQLLTLIYEQQVKEERLLALRMSEEAQHDLSEVARSRQQRQYDEEIVTNLQQAAVTTPPAFTIQQLRAGFGSQH